MSDDTVRVLVFEVAGQEHAVYVGMVKEILMRPKITRVIEAPDFVEGVIELRGRIVPIIALRKRLNLPKAPDSLRGCAIILRMGNRLVGFVADSVSEILSIPTKGIEPPDRVMGEVLTRFAEGVAYLEERFLIILDPSRILSIDEEKFVGNHEIDSSVCEPRKTNPASPVRKIIAFELDDELYGADIGDVSEIMKIVPIMPIPNVPDFILGLINLRGVVIPVADIRRLFHPSQKPFDADSRIIITKTEDFRVGVVADRLWELLRIPSDAFQPLPPNAARIDSTYCKEVCRTDERMLIVLDIAKLLAESGEKLSS